MEAVCVYGKIGEMTVLVWWRKQIWGQKMEVNCVDMRNCRQAVSWRRQKSGWVMEVDCIYVEVGDFAGVMMVRKQS